MASSTSLKELSKSLNAFIVEPTLPLSDDVLDTISSFSQRREEYDDAAADRLQDELQSIFEKKVKGNIKATGAWIAVMRRLLPVLQTPGRILPWFDACKGILDQEDLDKNVVDETVAAMMALVTVIDEYQVSVSGESPASRIIDRLFEVWMNRFYPALLDGNVSSEYNERLIRQALSNFGKKRPKEFFTIINNYFIQKKYRKSALRFLCDFIQSQPPHLHQVLDTSIFSNLLTCLQQDTSTTIVSAALTTLIMLLPHMPSSLVPHLPALFNVYARLLFWDRERSRHAQLPDHDGSAAGWDICAFDPEIDDQTMAHLPNYYTILYGLYPINFMDYIRKPQRYMRHANVSNADEIDVQPTEMRHRSERFRRNHLLHPNFYSLTIDSEKTDFGRWIKSEAAEVVAECMGLCLEADLYNFADLSTVGMSGATGPHDASLDDGDGLDRAKADAALLSGSAGGRPAEGWRNSHLTSTDSASSNHTPLTMMRRGSQSSQPSNRDSGGAGSDLAKSSRMPGADSPMLTQSPSHPQLQDLLQSNKAIKSGLHQSLANDSVPSLALSHQDSVAEKALGGVGSSLLASTHLPPSSHSPFSFSDGSPQVAHLQKQILLLQNDLSFERYLKQQHMAHIGDLRRKQMSEAATEAETQNLILMNRSLKSRFEDAKKSEMQVKKESEKSRAMAKKWEADLANKLKNLREESKKTHGELESLQRELHESKQENEKLRKLVCAAEVNELNAKQNMQSIEIHGAEIDDLKAEVERLTRIERDNQARVVEQQTAINSATEAENQAEVLKMKLAAQETDVQRTKKLFQSQVAALQAQLSEAQEERERPGANANIAVESALAASRAKQAELQKQYGLLMRKYTALQSSLLDMQSEQAPEFQQQQQQRGHQARQDSRASEAEYLAMSTSPVMMKNRQHRAFSNAEAMGHAAGSSLGSQSGMPGTGPTLTQVASSSPLGTGAAESAPIAINPEQRHFGSGLQSRLRRDSKDKGRDDASSGSGKPKKEKKSSGLRGIRGFV